MKRILVAVDGSDNAKKALLTAKRIGVCEQADLTVLYVIMGMSAYRPYGIDITYEDHLNTAMKEHMQKVLNDVKEELADYTGGEICYASESGDPATSILEVAEREKMDLIIIGSRGLNRVSRMVMGSVSNKVVHNAPCSVHVVR